VLFYLFFIFKVDELECLLIRFVHLLSKVYFGFGLLKDEAGKTFYSLVFHFLHLVWAVYYFNFSCARER